MPLNEYQNKNLHSFENEINTRLDFLKFILSVSGLKLDPALVTVIWDSLLLRSNAAEQQLGFSILLSLCSDQFFSVEAYQLLINDRFPKLNLQVINTTAFFLLERLFILVNSIENKIENSNNLEELTITSFDLIGLPTFWSLVLRSEDSQVAERSFTFLYTLLNRVGLKKKVEFLCGKKK